MYSRNNRRVTRRARHAFSLIEIMVVIVIIGLLAGVLAVNVAGTFAQSNVETTKIQMAKLVDQLELYKQKNGKYPTEAEGLQLLTQPSEETGYSAVEEGNLLDSWRNPFAYIVDGNSYEIISLGADGKEGGEGENRDISHKDL